MTLLLSLLMVPVVIVLAILYIVFDDLSTAREKLGRISLVIGVPTFYFMLFISLIIMTPFDISSIPSPIVLLLLLSLGLMALGVWLGW